MDIIKIVVRYTDGRVLRGYTHDFFPDKSLFHLKLIADGNKDKVIEVHIKELKAVFFVKDFFGNPSYNEERDFEEAKNIHGRKIEVTFKDGEILSGSTVGYDPNRPGFFIFPVDPRSNNLKIFVISKAVTKVRYL
jgi:hypothetical protein